MNIYNLEVKLKSICPYLINEKVLNIHLFAELFLTGNNITLLYEGINNEKQKLLKLTDIKNIDELIKSIKDIKTIDEITIYNKDKQYKFQYKEVTQQTICIENIIKNSNIIKNYDFNISKNSYSINQCNVEYDRVINIKKKFIETYFNANKLKSDHLSDKCRERNNTEQNTTSKCNLTEFCLILDKKLKSYVFAEYNNILIKEKIQVTVTDKINKTQTHLAACFILVTTYNLFAIYLNSVVYCKNILMIKPEMLNDANNLFFTKDTYFSIDEKDEIKIKHMNKIHDIEIVKNKVKSEENLGLIKFFKTPRRNDVIFE